MVACCSRILAESPFEVESSTLPFFSVIAAVSNRLWAKIIQSTIGEQIKNKVIWEEWLTQTVL